MNEIVRKRSSSALKAGISKLFILDKTKLHMGLRYKIWDFVLKKIKDSENIDIFELNIKL